MERRLKGKDDWLFELFTKSGDYIEIIFTTEGQILYINSILPFHNIKDVLNSSIYDYIGVEYMDITKNSINKALNTGEKVVYETIINFNKNEKLSFYYLNRLNKEYLDDKHIVLHLIAIDITMYCIIQNELQNINDKYIIDSLCKLDEGLIYRVLNPDLTIKFTNALYNKIFSNNTDNFGINVLEQFSYSDKEIYLNYISEILKKKISGALNIKERKPNGIFLECRWNDHPVFDSSGKVKEICSYGMIKEFGSKCDVSNKLKTYKNLLQNGPVAFWEEDASELKKYLDSISRQDFESNLQKSFGEILKCASKIKITSMNTKSIALFKVNSIEEINKKSLIFFFNNETIEIFKKRLISLVNGRTYFESPCSSINAKGESIDFLIKVIIPDGYEDTFKKIFVFMIEDTEKNKLKRDIEKQYNQLVRADRLKSLGIMVAGIAHEINNPNQVVMLNSSLIKQYFAGLIDNVENSSLCENDVLGMPLVEFKNNLNELVKGIEESSEKIKYIVNELKNYTIHGCNASKKIIDINKIVKSAIRFTKNFINNSTDNFEVVYSKTPIIVFADQIALEQVFINIIENACQALSDKTKYIRIEVNKNKEKYAAVKIIDSGIGINNEDLIMLMTPFFSKKRDQNGTGLGLFISNNIIENHNGTIKIKSELGKGTQVEILIPTV